MRWECAGKRGRESEGAGRMRGRVTDGHSPRAAEDGSWTGEAPPPALALLALRPLEVQPPAGGTVR